jgi:hypothetical protein
MVSGIRNFFGGHSRDKHENMIGWANYIETRQTDKMAISNTWIINYTWNFVRSLCHTWRSSRSNFVNIALKLTKVYERHVHESCEQVWVELRLARVTVTNGKLLVPYQKNPTQKVQHFQGWSDVSQLAEFRVGTIKCSLSLSPARRVRRPNSVR